MTPLTRRSLFAAVAAALSWRKTPALKRTVRIPENPSEPFRLPNPSGFLLERRYGPVQYSLGFKVSRQAMDNHALHCEVFLREVAAEQQRERDTFGAHVFSNHC